MRKTLRSLILVSLLLSMVFSSAAEQQASALVRPGLDLKTAYEDMTQAVTELRNYALAREYFTAYGFSQTPIEQSRLYELYLEALDHIDNGRYSAARSLLESLAIQPTPFLDSIVLCNYCSGQLAESSRDYEEAIRAYQVSIVYKDAKERLEHCVQADKKQKRAEAEALYERGVSQGHANTLQQAYESAKALGEDALAEKCQTAILDLNKKQNYESAQAMYREAAASQSILELNAALSAFEALGDYADSAAKLQEIRLLLSAAQRKIALVSESASARSITLAWSDSAPDPGGYVVTWTAQGNNALRKVTVQEAACTLKELLPDTVYQITVTVASMPQLVLQADISTKAADAYRADGFMMNHNGRAAGMLRWYLSMNTLGSMLVNNPNVPVYPENNALPMEEMDPTLQEMAYGFVVSYVRDSQISTEATQQWILRTRDNGVYAMPEFPLTLHAQGGTEVILLDDLLSALFKDQGAWPKSSSFLEWYINGELAAKGSLIIEGK